MGQESSFQFPELIVVEASAGSGKTYQLAKRYVQLLFQLTAYPQEDRDRHAMRQILALTFANKAAAEMRQRIIALIKKTALKILEPHEKQDLLDAIGLDEEKASKIARELMEILIREFNFFQVQTIDSFIRTVLAGCAFKIDRSARFKIRRDSNVFIEQAVDGLIDKARSDKSAHALLLKFLDQYLFIEARKGWMPKKDIYQAMMGLFRVMNTYGSRVVSYPFEAKDIPEQKRKILSLSYSFIEGCEEEGVAIKKFLRDFLGKHETGFDTGDLSKVFVYDDPPCNKGKAPSSGLLKIWQAIRYEVDSLCQNESYGIYNIHIELFQAVLGGFKHLTRVEDVVFIEELNKTACSLLSIPEFLPELYYRLAVRFSHYLIDEFQDTNPLQWFNLYPLITEALGSGGSFFYVGDKKQAIYSFRGGDSRLFDEVQKQFNISAQVNRLEQNFRSRKEIVEFNNHLFSLENMRRALFDIGAYLVERKKSVEIGKQDVDQMLSVFEGATQQVRPGHDGGRVEVRRRASSRTDAVKDDVMALVQDFLKRYSPSDIAILTRKGDQGLAVASWLLEQGIPVQTEKTSHIHTNVVVKELNALLAFLESPIDELAFVSFLSGDVFSKASAIPLKELEDFLFENRKLKGTTSGLIYKAFAKAYPEAWGRLIEPFFRKVGLMPLYELSVSLLEEWKVIDHFPLDRAFVVHWLEIIRHCEEEFMDVESFLKYFEEIDEEMAYVPIAGKEAIRVLTVHKAKGLEFPVVILPFLEMSVSVGPRGGDASYTVDRAEDDLRLKRLTEKTCIFSETVRRDYDAEYKKNLANELNTLYVALTRASSEMVIFLSDKAGASINLAKFFIPEGKDIYGAKSSLPVVVKKTINQGERKIFSVTPFRSWLEVLDDEFGESLSLERMDASFYGQAVHFILAMLGDVRGKDVRTLASELQGLVHSSFPFLQDITGCFKEALDVVGSRTCKEFFYPVDAEVRCEEDVVNSFGDTRRMDRVLFTKDHVVVIDFKTGEPEDTDVLQVQEYIKILKEIYLNKTIEGYLIYTAGIKVVEVTRG